MKIVTAAQMRAVEERTFTRLGVPALLLMETAGRELALLAWRLLTGAPAPDGPGPGPCRLKGWAPAAAVHLAPPGRPPRVVAFAGRGNNGGDALCAARHLHNWGVQVAAVLWGDPSGLPPDARLNLDACRQAGVPVWLGGAVDLTRLPADGSAAAAGDQMAVAELLAGADLVLDGLLGTGSRGPAREPVLTAIRLLNQTARPVLAEDLPSGVAGDTGAAPGPAVQAAWTLALGLLKPCHVLHPGAARCGEVWLADIALPAAAVAAESIHWETIAPAQAGARLPQPAADAHKGTRGRILIAGGCRSMPGAPALAGLAALRTGAGLVYVAVPEPAGDLVAGRAPELITLRLPAAPDGGFAPAALAALQESAARVNCVAVGPGLGEGEAARAAARALTLAAPVPVVLDADGVRAFAGQPELLRQAAAPVVLTPHPAELGALLGGLDAAGVQADRPGALARAVAATGQIVLLKGAHTLVGTPDGRVRVNLTGHPVLATAGSGDVLTGIIAALIAQGLAPAEAAAAGACLHGYVGERLAQQVGPDGVLAGDLAHALPGARRALAEMRGERTSWQM